MTGRGTEEEEEGFIKVLCSQNDKEVSEYYFSHLLGIPVGLCDCSV